MGFPRGADREPLVRLSAASPRRRRWDGAVALAIAVICGALWFAIWQAARGLGIAP